MFPLAPSDRSRNARLKAPTRLPTLGSGLAAVILLLPAVLGAPARSRTLNPSQRPALYHMVQGPADFIPWTFREDFSHGIPGWISFPLPQDVGYDPSVYTTETGGSLVPFQPARARIDREAKGFGTGPVLVRDVTAYGQKLLRVGLLRTLQFHATPSSSFRMVYDLEVCGKLSRMAVTLATVDGRRYTRPLPLLTGPHEARLEGREFQLPTAGTDVEVIVIQAEVAAPSLGSHNRLTLRAFEVTAERPPSLPLEAPQLERSSVDEVAVARAVVTPESPLIVRLGPGQATQAAIYDGAGRLVRRETIPEGASRPVTLWQPIASTAAGLWKVEMTRGPARADFRFLVLGKVPAHPRVLLTAERLEQLRSQAYGNELLAIVHRRAAELRGRLAYNPDAGQNIARLSPVSVLPGIYDYFALIGNYSQGAAFNALDFRMSGDPQALEAARRALGTVAQWSTWTPAWFGAHGLRTYYGVGGATQELVLGYDLIADQLTKEEKSQIADALWRNSILPTLEDYFFFDRMVTAASNHAAQSVGGAIDACIALYGDVPDWEGRFGPALAELIVAYEHLLEGLFPGDGSEAEPAGYEDFAMEGMSWGMAALQAVGIRPRDADKMLQSFWWLRYAQVRPDLVLDTGDFQAELRALSGFAWGAENAGDPALRAFYESATGHTLMSQFGPGRTGGALQSQGGGGRAREEMPGLLDLTCCTHPPVPVPDPPPSRIFPLRGSAVLRSGWQPEDTVISLRLGPWFNHEHHDQGSFRVAAWGEELIAEAGYADYYRDPHYPDYFTQATAHNTIVVDGDAFSQEDYDGRYWRSFQRFPKFERHVFSSGLDYLSANLVPAYGDGAALDQFTREYLFIKPDILIVRDRLRAASAHRFTWLLHVPVAAQTQIDATGALIRRKAALAALTAGGEITHWTRQQMPIPTTTNIGDLDRIVLQPREAFRLDSPAEKAGTFLVAMRFQKASEEPLPLRPLRSASGEGFQTPDGLTAVLFRTQAAPLTTGGLTADGDVLALTDRGGLREIFVSQARSLRRERFDFAHRPEPVEGQQELFSSTAAIDALLRASPSFVELRLVCAREIDLKILAERPPAEVTLDQARVTPVLVGGYVSLAQLTQGEHVVRISY